MYKTILKSIFPVIFGAASAVSAQEIPNTSQTPGDILVHTGQEMGRLAIIDIIGDFVVTVPEAPSSPPNSDFLERVWDLTDPTNPIEVDVFKQTTHPFQAHGLIKRNNELYVGGFPNNALVVNEVTGRIEPGRWTGPNVVLRKSGMAYPYSGTDYWSYGTPSGNASILMNRVQVANWDHLNTTGVIGFANFMGDILIYGSDQSKSGVAAYDISDPSNPVLLSVINEPDPHPSIQDRGRPVEGGIGGYWNEIYGHYLVFPRRGSNPGLQVVDFSDPNNLRLHCDFFPRDPASGVESSINDFGHLLYVGFQDEWMFGDRYKVNVETCEVELVFDELAAGAEMGQYSRPIGNLLLAGGGNNWRISGNSAGLSVWAHQAEPDTRPPFVAYHIPQANRTNYSTVSPISIHIPETLRSETIIVGDTLTVTEVGGGQVDIDYVLSHTGMLTVYAAVPPENPLDGWLRDNTTYEVRLDGIQDAVRNVMPEYSFRFSTGSSISGGPVPTPEPTPEPTESPTPDPAVTESPTPEPTESPTSEPTPTPEPTMAPNLPPNIPVLSVSSNLVLAGETVTISAVSSDPEGEPIEFRFDFSDGNGPGPWGPANSADYTFTSPGLFIVTVQVRDSQGTVRAATKGVTVISETFDNVDHSLISSPISCDAEMAGFGRLTLIMTLLPKFHLLSPKSSANSR